MQMPPGARTGVLVVRLWREGEAGTPLKARITQTTDILTAENVVTTVGSVEEICAVVRAWAGLMVGGAETGAVPEVRGGAPALGRRVCWTVCAGWTRTSTSRCPAAWRAAKAMTCGRDRAARAFAERCSVRRR